MRHPAVAAILALAVVSGCGRAPERASALALPTVSVRAEPVTSRERTASEDVVGTVRARLHAVIEAKVSGEIERMLVVPGQNVAAGATLCVIHAREVSARLEQAQALRQKADDDLKRATSLLAQKILPQSEFDAAQSRFRVAEAAVAEAETLLGYTQIRAPFAGTITRKDADVGDLAAPGKPLLEIEDSRTLRFEADVPEAVVPGLSLGQPLAVRIAAIPGDLRGTIAEIAPTADPASRTFLVKLDLPPNPALRAGQFGRVGMPVGTSTALRVPSSAVVVRGQMEIVFLVEDGKARLRIVKTGKRIGDDVEVVSGLDAGERIVVENNAGLIDGQPLQLR